ncbi:MAG: 50S ribosomal protein L6 [Planctomycetes bacterium]|nr:50S ribosomal protein L6 [Planctomycetota bacterium]
MSRIGRQPVPVPAGVKATVGDGTVQIAGPLGQIEQTIAPGLRVVVDDAKKAVRVERTADDRQTKALHGLLRNLIANMIAGVTKGYVRGIQVVGVGYAAKLEGNDLVLQVGYHNDLRIPVPKGLKLDPPESGNLFVAGVGSVPCATVRIRGVDKQKVNEFASELRRLKPAEPYRGKGIRYEGEEIRRKAGKAFAAQE